MKNIPYNYKYQYLKNNSLKSVKVLNDDVEFDTTNPDEGFSFGDYSDAIVRMVNGSYQKLSVGIYGEWGSGKTTLMKLVEKKLRPAVFNWQNVPGSDSDKLKDFLKSNFDNMDWIATINLDFERKN